MKKNIYPIIALLALCFCMLSACTDDLAGGWTASDGAVSMKITLKLPASSSAQTRAATDELEAERRMDVEGMHLLVFENNILKEDIKEKQLGAEVDGKRILTAKSTETYKNTVNVVILANMNKNGIAFNSNNYIGKSKAELYKALKYTYGTEAWDVVGSDEQYIPMWGAFTLTPSSGDNNVNVSLYRAVSKINVLVGNGGGLDNFTLTSVRVYYANQEGYAAPFVEPTGTQAVESPSIGTDFTQSDVKFPLVYEETKGTVALKNRIYLPESNNKELADEKKPLCLVVGGKYTGAGLVDNGNSFYRIDFKDKDGIYDALRNHLYIFDINSVSSPGTTTPEEALDNAVVGMDVTIESWNDTYMNGLTSQYSLVTDKSRASFDQKGGDITITVSSDYTEPWKVVDVMGEWFKHDVSGNKIILTTTANYGASRIGSFCIQAGQLKKQIFVDQAQPGTANCYLVEGGETYEMSVVLKGNGTSGLTAESKGGGTVELEKSAELEPAYLSVIWETEKGLITLINTDGSVSDKANYNTATGILKYRVKDNPKANYGKLDGGNALIGAFNENDEVIWSWHIWVCPKMLASNNNNDEVWKLTGYKVMDRNLGALSNQPGVGSLGLLYQWGRKDPFIGAAEISDDSEIMPTVNYLSHTWDVAENNDSSKTVPFTVKNPTKLIHDGLSKGEKGAFLWGTDGGLAAVGIKDLGKKTIYDPCPIGYRVPPVDAFVFKGTTTYMGGMHETYPYEGQYIKEDFVDYKWGEGQPHGPTYASTSLTFNGPVWVTFREETKKTWKKEYVEEGTQFTISAGADYALIPYKKNVILSKSSETKNWDENLVYIPNNLQTGVSIGDWVLADYLYQPTDGWIKGDYYGFYLNYNEVIVPKMKDQGKDHYTLANKSNITWLPLSGAYDPTIGLKFSGVTIQQGSSLTVNSFIWTNSSVTSIGDITRPAALFLHGANPLNKLDGRHIHALNRDNLKAEPHYAGAVRCVRDEKKDFAEENKVPTGVSFGGDINAVFKSAVFAINENWRVIDPGAPWVRITPDRGAADKGRGTEVTFTAAKANDGSAPRTTIMKIQIGDKVHDVSIEQKAN